MTVVDAVDFQGHEFDVHYHFVEYGLQPYYALNSIRNDHDWRTEGKPTETMELLGDSWKLALDFDGQPLQPWTDDSYQLGTTPLFRLYFVADDELYDGERADQSERVKGGTMTVRPRWPDMKKDDGSDVNGYMDLGKPYLDVQVQASNIDPRSYHELVRSAFAAYDLNPNYFATPNDSSNIGDCAVYVRPRRSESGPIHAADGPIARMHNLFTGDRSGYRKHVEDNRKIEGYYVSSTITDERVSDLIPGHQYGKEVKHYYPENPRYFEPSDALYHPKVEVSYQTNHTDETVYWDDLDDLLRELDETLLSTLEWAGLSIRAGDHFKDDAYFSADSESRRSRKIPNCPLPEIEDAQEQTVINLWRNMNTADETLVNHLLADGGAVSPQSAADETGYSYRTIRECIDRLEGFIHHSYGSIEIASKSMQQKMLKRLRAADENFRNAIGSAAMEVADAATDRATSAWNRWKRDYNVTVQDAADCRKLLKVRYRPTDRQDARDLVRECRTAYKQVFDGSMAGIHIQLEFADGTRQRIRNLREFGFNKSPTSAKSYNSKMMEAAREKWGEGSTDPYGPPG